MGKYIIVPDVHGESFWKDAVDHIKDNYKVIFLGDYFDSYSNISRDKELKNFQEILDFKEADPDSVVLLLGNHDFAYMFSQGCSRQARGEDFKAISQALWDNVDQMGLTCKINVTRSNGDRQKVLCSHAGITDQWLRWLVHTLNWEQNTDDMFHAICSGMLDLMLLRAKVSDRAQRRLTTALWQTAPVRGGDTCGSIIWADSSEWPRKAVGCQAASKRNIIQFTGHNRCGVCKFTDDVFCFDGQHNKIQLID